MLRQLRLLSLLAATAVTLGACGDDDDDNGTGPVQQGRVRAVHAIGNAPAVDIAADGNVAVQDLAFGQKSAYLTVNAGTRALGVRAADGTTDLLTYSANVAANTDYTVLAIGRFGATTGPTPRLVPIVDNAAPPAGQASIRVVHGSPAAGAVDVYATAPNGDLATATPAIADFQFGEVNPVITVPAGTYRFRVTPTGAKTPVAIDVNNVTLAAGGKYIAIAVGDNAPGSGNATNFTLLLFPENAN